jgi:hypothetical protein
MKYSLETTSCGMIYIPSFMKIGTSFQATLRFCLDNSEAVILVLLMEKGYEIFT